MVGLRTIGTIRRANSRDHWRLFPAATHTHRILTLASVLPPRIRSCHVSSVNADASEPESIGVGKSPSLVQRTGMYMLSKNTCELPDIRADVMAFRHSASFSFWGVEQSI